MNVEQSPISHAVSVARLPQKGMPVTIDADEAQRAALARAHELVSVGSLRADLLVTSWKRDGIKVSGRLQAQIVQSCIVTLEPIDATVDEEVSALFLPEGSKLALPDALENGEILLDAAGPDSPEIFSGDTIDVGKLAEEFFSLGIDPYPRKSGASLQAGAEGGEEKRGPLFEKLQALRKKL